MSSSGTYDPAHNPIVLRIRHALFDVRDQEDHSLISVWRDLEYLQKACGRAMLDVEHRMNKLGEIIP